MQQCLEKFFSVRTYEDEKKLLIKHLEEARAKAERLKEENNIIKRSGCRRQKKLFHKMLEDKEEAGLENKKYMEEMAKKAFSFNNAQEKEGKDVSVIARGKAYSRKKRNYSIGCKAAIIRRLENEENLSIHKLSEELGIDRHSIRQWVQQKEQIFEQLLLNNTKADRLPGGGRKVLHPEIDREMIKWIQNERSEGNQITEKRLFTHCRLKYRNIGLAFSEGWLRSFMERHHLSYRSKTHAIFVNKDKISEDVERWTNQLCIKSYTNPEITLLANMDETGIMLDPVTRKTIDSIGAKTIHIKTTNSTHIRYSVALCCFSDGTKLPPFIIFPSKATKEKKGKRIKKKLQTQTASLGFSKSGMMNRELCLEWLNTTWKSNIEDPTKVLLIVDNHASHSIISEETPNVTYLPPNTTTILQPLDLSINAVFKEKVREKWETWISTNSSYTEKGYLVKPSKQLFIHWIEESWENLEKTVIISGFSRLVQKIEEGIHRIDEEVENRNHIKDHPLSEVS